MEKSTPVGVFHGRPWIGQWPSSPLIEGTIAVRAYFSELSACCEVMLLAELTGVIEFVLIIFQVLALTPVGILLVVFRQCYMWILQVVFVLPTLYPVSGITLNYAPVAVGIVLVGTLFVWVLPFIGARHWYKGAAAATGGLAKLRELKDYDDSVKAGTNRAV